jgi:hypothetical protein
VEPRKASYVRFRSTLLHLLIIVTAVGPAHAAELDQQTVAAWDKYVASATLHMQDRLDGKSPFLWVDEDPMTRRRVESGEIVVSPLGSTHPLLVPRGFIHHWMGAVFIPGARIRDLSGVVGDYSKYSEVYRPSLIKAELLDSTADEQKFCGFRGCCL